MLEILISSDSASDGETKSISSRIYLLIFQLETTLLSRSETSVFAKDRQFYFFKTTTGIDQPYSTVSIG